jgi:hypothetical protein
MAEVARSMADDAESDQPILHRKKHADEGSNSGSSGTGNGTGNGPASGSAPADDPDRPTLHRHDAGNTTNTSDSGSPNSNSPSDPDRPTLHKKDSGTSTNAPADDPDRPVLKKKSESNETAHVDAMPEMTDPDRPRLQRGKSGGNGLDIVPSLIGLPPEMQQTVAVSDRQSRPAHPWSYSWANEDDEAKMKLALEQIARSALGLDPPAPPVAPHRTAARKTAKPAPEPAPLEDEQFRVFELAYSSGATMVLSAHTDAPLAKQKFVTIIAQPDLYGNALVVLKSVTNGDHLDETPRMKLVDAVDAMADNRGELLFELRGQTRRQFALYRILRGQAEKLFVSGGGEFGAASAE